MLLQIVKDCTTSQVIDGITLESGWQVTSPYLSDDDCSSTDSIDYEEETQEFGIWFKLLLLDYVTINVITKQMEWSMSSRTKDLLKSGDHSPHTTLDYHEDDFYNISIEELFDTASQVVDQVEQVAGQRSVDVHRNIVLLLYNHVLPQIKLTREDKPKLEYHLQSQTNNIKKIDAHIEAWNSTGQALKHTIKNLTKQIVPDLQAHPLLKAARPELKELCLEELKRQLHAIEKRAVLDAISTEDQKEVHKLKLTIAELMKRPKGAVKKWVKKYDWYMTERENVYSSLQLSCNELKQCKKLSSRLTLHKIRAINIKESLHTTLNDLNTDDISFGFDVQSPAGRTQGADVGRIFQSLGDCVNMITMNYHTEPGKRHIETCNWIIEECAATALVWKENKDIVPTQDGNHQSPCYVPSLDGMIDDGFIVIAAPDVFAEVSNRISTQCAYMTGAFFKHIPRLDKTYANTKNLILAYECILYRRIYRYLYNVLELRYDSIITQLLIHMNKLDWLDFDLDEPWIPQLLLMKSEPVKPSDSVVKRWLTAVSQENLDLEYQNMSVLERTPSPSSRLPAFKHKEKYPSFRQQSNSEHHTENHIRVSDTVNNHSEPSQTPIPRSASKEQYLDLSSKTIEHDNSTKRSLTPAKTTAAQYIDDSVPKPLPRKFKKQNPKNYQSTMIPNPLQDSDVTDRSTSEPFLPSTDPKHIELLNGQLSKSTKPAQHYKNSNSLHEVSTELEELDLCLDEALTVLDLNGTEFDGCAQIVSLPTALKVTVDENVERRTIEDEMMDTNLTSNLKTTFIGDEQSNQGKTSRPDTLTVPGQSDESCNLRVKVRSRSVGTRRSNRKARAINGEINGRHTYTDVELDKVKHTESPISPQKLMLTSETKEQVDKVISKRRSKSYRRSKTVQSYVPSRQRPSTNRRPRTDLSTNHAPLSDITTNQSDSVKYAAEESSEIVDSAMSDDTVTMKRRFLELFDDSVQVLNSVQDVYSPLEKSQKLAKCLRCLSSQLSNVRQNIKFQTSCSSDDLVTAVIILLLSIDKTLFRSIYLQLKFISVFMDEFMEGGVHNFSLVQFIAAIQYIQDSVVSKVHNRKPTQSSC